MNETSQTRIGVATWMMLMFATCLLGGFFSACAFSPHKRTTTIRVCQERVIEEDGIPAQKEQKEQGPTGYNL